MKKITLLLIFSFSLTLSCSESANSSSAEKEVATANPIVPPSEKVIPKAVAPPAIPIDSSITLDYIMGKFDPAKDPRFVIVDPKNAKGRKDRLLRIETYTAFLKMHKAAKADGIDFQIISATRNFATQKIIWEGKWTGKRLHESKENLAKTTPNPTNRALKILKWSSMPGTSRHHWGTDMDLNALTNEFFEKGEGLKMFNWLTANAATYGFCQPYSPKDAKRPHGYNEEKWHWSYLPIAQRLTEQAQLRLGNEMIEGFLGAETAVEIGVVDQFILGINGECL